MPTLQGNQMERKPATGISILEVWAGIGGLTFAIEAYRKGHDVRVVERSPEGQYFGQYIYHDMTQARVIIIIGEIIMITTSALHTPNKWLGSMQRARAAAYSPIFDSTPIETHAPGDAKNPCLSIYRRKLHNLLVPMLKSLAYRLRSDLE